jgi:hypothetical protein
MKTQRSSPSNNAIAAQQPLPNGTQINLYNNKKYAKDKMQLRRCGRI